MVEDVFQGTPDPWQCDALDALVEEDNVAVRACHGVGKTALIAWAVDWFLATRPFSKIPITAPTFNKQVRDVLFAEIHKWWRIACINAPWLQSLFDLHPTRMTSKRYPKEWFAVGIASNQPIMVEGYHAPHLMAVFDEAKGIKRGTWESIHGMRTTQAAKLLACSTPGAPLGEFFKVCTEYRSTWRRVFVIHPFWLKDTLMRPEAAPGAKGGTYYSKRVRRDWVEERGAEWGTDSPVYIAKVIGDFPDIEGDVLIPYRWLAAAEDLEDGAPGPTWVSCDVARYGRDRTVFMVGTGGTIFHSETVARTPSETTVQELQSYGIGDDPKAPRYRAVDVTAEIVIRLVRQYEASGAIVDDTGLGGGVTEILRGRGVKVVGINFGASPTDKPKSPEARAYRLRRFQVESHFRNLKAQLGLALRAGFEQGMIALGRLPHHITDPLIAQCSLVRQDIDTTGRIFLVDPDEVQDESLPGTEDVEGKRSPDHFHALMLLWAATGTAITHSNPKAGQAVGTGTLPASVIRAGRRHALGAIVPTDTRPQPRAGSVGATQKDHLKTFWRGPRR